MDKQFQITNPTSSQLQINLIFLTAMSITSENLFAHQFQITQDLKVEMLSKAEFIAELQDGMDKLTFSKEGS